MLWLPLVTVKLWETEEAGFQLALPAWSALIVQVPIATRVTLVPLVPPVVHTAPVVEVKLTASPEVAVALTVTGPSSRRLVASAPKEMLWLPWVTVKLWETE